MTIDPTENDIGERVVYTGNKYPGGKPEYGTITGFNDHTIFVKYDGENTQKARTAKI